ncbi:hypothetical protein IWX76_000751 [Pedobacter sp. CAN_A7]|uniref:hypothetical protein n=1 Tax=Pedobacter sp. CAN_A7 TaxID=2787722 RepID=UPI0018CB5511
MKNILFAVLFGVASFSSINSQAQVNVNINLAAQPQWGPAGYDHVEYYYIPDMDVYYYVPSSQYVYQNNGNWKWSKNLPSKYKNYDLYNSYKVVMNQKQPYLSHQNHVKQYSNYKNNKGKQVSLRDKKSNYNQVNKRSTVSRSNRVSVKSANQNVRTNASRASNGNNANKATNGKIKSQDRSNRN